MATDIWGEVDSPSQKDTVDFDTFPSDTLPSDTLPQHPCRSLKERLRNWRKPKQIIRKLEDYPRGYPKLSRFIDNDDWFMLPTKFSYVRSRLLWYRQNELEMLERPLLDMDRHDALEFNKDDIMEPNSRRRGSAAGDTRRHKVLKRGLSGTMDGLKVSALADTGAARNVVSTNFARARKLDVVGSPSSFRLGNSKLAHSLGTVNVRWAFADKPTETVEVVCHVISNCAYDVILGRRFLSMTETFTKYKHRLTNCLSSAARVLRINLLDESRQFLKGTLGDRHQTDAVPDTGAEGNVMDLRYAEEHGFNIKRGAENRRMLEFADGSRQRAVGQVETSWTFDSGQRIPLVFEVLEDCLHDVILGEEVLWEHDVFETYAASIQTLPSDTESFDLAPFSFVPTWMQKLRGKCKKRNPKPIDLNALELEERRRRDIWNYQHNFISGNASEQECEAERERRRQYEERLALARLTLEGRGSLAPESHAQSIPSIPTAPNGPH